MELLLDTLMQTLASYLWPLFRVASMLMVMVV
ncbi:MAG: flagellar biosynthetic protein FliR, partial [Shewanella sp.]